MSLTEKAMFERKWKHFPALAAVLSDKRLGVEWTGLTSVSDNIFERTCRLLEIYALVSDNGQEITRLLSSQSGEPVREDLLRLSEALIWASRTLAEASNATTQLARSS